MADLADQRQWKYDPNFSTEVEVRLIPETGGTRVELEHRDRFGAAASDIRAAFDSPQGWMGDLERLRAILDRAA